LFYKVQQKIAHADDGPILNAYYRTILCTLQNHENAEKRGDRLLEAHLLHTLYANKIEKKYRSQVVLVGGGHIESILPIIEQLGYQKVVTVNVWSNKHPVTILDECLAQAHALGNEKREQIDTLYYNTLNTLTLDLGTLTRNL